MPSIVTLGLQVFLIDTDMKTSKTFVYTRKSGSYQHVRNLVKNGSRLKMWFISTCVDLKYFLEPQFSHSAFNKQCVNYYHLVPKFAHLLPGELPSVTLTTGVQFSWLCVYWCFLYKMIHVSFKEKISEDKVSVIQGWKRKDWGWKRKLSVAFLTVHFFGKIHRWSGLGCKLQEGWIKCVLHNLTPAQREWCGRTLKFILGV